jgi:hypothetical protein
MLIHLRCGLEVDVADPAIKAVTVMTLTMLWWMMLTMLWWMMLTVL